MNELKPLAIRSAREGLALTVWKLPTSWLPTYRVSNTILLVISCCTPSDQFCVYGSWKLPATCVKLRLPGLTPRGISPRCSARTSLPKNPDVGRQGAVQVAALMTPALTTGAAVA